MSSIIETEQLLLVEFGDHIYVLERLYEIFCRYSCGMNVIKFENSTWWFH